MIKYLLLAGIAYIAYRLFFNKPLLKGPSAKSPLQNAGEEEEDFIDYEEVD